MINWNKYCDHIYFLHLKDSNTKDFIDNLQKLELYRKQILSIEYYDTSKNFNEYKYFKDVKILSCIVNAFFNNYNRIIIFRDDLLFEDLETIKTVLNNCIYNQISILNPNDINEDALMLNKNVIHYIYHHFFNYNIYKEQNWNIQFRNLLNEKFNIYKPEQSICQHKIDYIIPYVNDKDNIWVEKFNKYYSVINHESYNAKNRWNSLDNFVYNIRSVAKNIPWINNLFIIVDSESQIPKWLNKDNVKIIYHKDFIPNEYLPIFNSCAIESFIYNIEELSEYFLFSNDDIFITKELDKKIFFENGNTKNKFITTSSSNKNHYKISNNSFNLINKEFNIENMSYKRCIHVPHAMLKSSCVHIGQYFKKDICDSITKFRDNKNLNQYMYVIYELLSGNNITNNINNILININDSNIQVDQYDIVCIKDSNLYNTDNLLKINEQFNNLFYEKSKYDNFNNICIKDKLYVSFTSWTKRIKYCKHTVDLMMNQTLLPDKIILNLSEEEFPNKENDLPQDLVDEAKTNNLFEIYWVKENNKVWKKIMPTMDRFPEDLVFSIDDDIEYPSNYIEEMYKTYLRHNRLYPIVGYKNIQHGLFYHSGPFTLTSKKFYSEYLNDVYNNLVHAELKTHNWQSDSVYSYIALLNNVIYIPCHTINGNLLYKSSNINNENAYSNYKSEEWKQSLKRNVAVLNKYITNKYHKTLKDLIENNSIIVNFTTWKKRDKYTVKLLEHFKKQTIKPSKIICWLSKDEYNGIIPQSIQECLDKKLLTEVKWVDGNIYSHKRWETFKENNNYYNIMIDDDLYYPENYIEQLLNTSRKYPNTVVCYYTRTVNYSNGYRLIDKYINEPSLKNGMYSGLSCYPPNIFPTEEFQYSELRDEYCKYCDDSWVSAWLLKHNIKVIGVQEWFGGCLNEIDGTSETGIWVNHNSKKIDGIMQKYINQLTAYKIVGVTDIATNIWPNINFDKYVKNIRYKIK